jgi:hypothetical protein
MYCGGFGQDTVRHAPPPPRKRKASATAEDESGLGAACAGSPVVISDDQLAALRGTVIAQGLLPEYEAISATPSELCRAFQANKRRNLGFTVDTTYSPPAPEWTRWTPEAFEEAQARDDREQAETYVRSLLQMSEDQKRQGSPSHLTLWIHPRVEEDEVLNAPGYADSLDVLEIDYDPREGGEDNPRRDWADQWGDRYTDDELLDAIAYKLGRFSAVDATVGEYRISPMDLDRTWLARMYRRIADWWEPTEGGEYVPVGPEECERDAPLLEYIVDHLDRFHDESERWKAEPVGYDTHGLRDASRTLLNVVKRVCSTPEFYRAVVAPYQAVVAPYQAEQISRFAPGVFNV